MKTIIPLIARVFLSAIFLAAGIKHALGFEGLTKIITAKGIAAPDVFGALVVILLLTGSVLLLTGFKAKLGAFLLLMFLVPVSIIMHFDPSNPDQMTQFFKNLGLAGGLLMVMANGVGRLSVDGRGKNQEA